MHVRVCACASVHARLSVPACAYHLTEVMCRIFVNRSRGSINVLLHSRGFYSFPFTLFEDCDLYLLLCRCIADEKNC